MPPRDLQVCIISKGSHFLENSPGGTKLGQLDTLKPAESIVDTLPKDLACLENLDSPPPTQKKLKNP